MSRAGIYFFEMLIAGIPSKDILSDAEMKVLESAFEKFKDYGSSDISKNSYRGKRYRSTKKGEINSYPYAKEDQIN